MTSWTARHPLRIVLGELATTQAVRRIKLDGLSQEAVARLAEPLSVDADELYRKTAGNPFFVVEVLAGQADEIPDTVRDAIFARAARLSPPAKRLLEAVAVVPQQAELWLLEALAGDATDALEECLASGMLTSEQAGVAFRHELARLAVEESIALSRRVDLHRKALAALSDPPGGAPDLARLAHHAEAAGDSAAVLRFAPVAAARAATLGAHREAAAQLARAVRFGEGLPPAERADLLERRSKECFLTDQYDEGIAALEEAVECRRTLGDKLGEGNALRQLSEIPLVSRPDRRIGAGGARRSRAARRSAAWPRARVGVCQPRVELRDGMAVRGGDATLGVVALELADRLGDTETSAALTRLGRSPAVRGTMRSSNRASTALAAKDSQRVSRVTHVRLVGVAVEDRCHSSRARYLEPGIDFCSERGLELHRLYLLADRAPLRARPGTGPRRPTPPRPCCVSPARRPHRASSR